MGKSAVLLIDELAQGQIQAFTTVNNAIAALEQSENASIALDASGGPVEVPELDMLRHKVFYVSGHTAPETVQFPSQINVDDGPVVDTLRLIWVVNLENFALTVQTDDPGNSVEIPPGEAREVLIESVDVTEIGMGRFTESREWPVDFFYPGVPTDGAILFRYAVPRLISFPDNFNTPGVGTVVFSLQPDDADTITVDDGIKSVTFEFESGGGVGGGNTAVTIGGNVDITGANLARAVNEADLNVLAVYDAGSNTLTVYNLNGAGGDITKTDVDNDYAVTPFADGIDGARAEVGVAATANLYLDVIRKFAGVETQIGSIRIDPDNNALFRIGLPGTGSVLFNAQPDDADTLTVNDGFQSYIFEFESGGGVAAGNISVTIGATMDDTGANLAAAIMASQLNVSCFYDAGTNTATLRNHHGAGGSITKSDVDNDYTVTNFSGGTTPGSSEEFNPGTVLIVRNQQVADATAAEIAATLMANWLGF